MRRWRVLLDGRGGTGVHRAAEHGHASIMKLLLDKGADPRLYAKNADGCSVGRGDALHKAVVARGGGPP